MSYDIFISHANCDAELAHKISAHLKGLGVSCWIATRDIPSGTDFDVAILDAIDACNAALLVLSTNSNASLFVFSEINRAFARGKPIFTFRLSDVMPARQLELYVARQQWFDGFPPPIDERLNTLASSILALRDASKECEMAPSTHESPAEQTGKTVRSLSKKFYITGLVERIRTAAKVAELARMLPEKEILSLCQSTDHGERVAGYISLGVFIGSGVPAPDLTKLTAILESGILDPESRVRFRAVEAIGCSFQMMERFRPTLERLSANDSNYAVREMAQILAQEQRV